MKAKPLLAAYAPTAAALFAKLFTSDPRVINTLHVPCLPLYPLGLGLGILVARVRRGHNSRLLLQAGQAVLLSIPFALILGVAFRVMMRLVALAIGMEPTFSLGGTALIVHKTSLFHPCTSNGLGRGDFCGGMEARSRMGRRQYLQ